MTEARTTKRKYRLRRKNKNKKRASSLRQLTLDDEKLGAKAKQLREDFIREFETTHGIQHKSKDGDTVFIYNDFALHVRAAYGKRKDKSDWDLFSPYVSEMESMQHYNDHYLVLVRRDLNHVFILNADDIINFFSEKIINTIKLKPEDRPLHIKFVLSETESGNFFIDYRVKGAGMNRINQSLNAYHKITQIQTTKENAILNQLLKNTADILKEVRR